MLEDSISPAGWKVSIVRTDTGSPTTLEVGRSSPPSHNTPAKQQSAKSR